MILVAFWLTLAAPDATLYQGFSHRMEATVALQEWYDACPWPHMVSDADAD